MSLEELSAVEDASGVRLCRCGDMRRGGEAEVREMDEGGYGECRGEPRAESPFRIDDGVCERFVSWSKTATGVSLRFFAEAVVK